MLKQNTRFNPTVSGSPHLGHLYLALVNATEAHKSRGRFILRIDDSQPYWNWKLGKDHCRKLGEEFINQFRLFMDIDEVTWQSELPSYEKSIQHEINKLIPEVHFVHDQAEEWIPDPDMALYPYAPWFTIEKVFWDFNEGTTWLIRGEDLVSEACLYNFFVDILGFPRVKQTYLPRLRAKNREELHLTEISKTFRNYNLLKEINLYGVDTVLEYLKQSCLKDTNKEFTVDNIKCNPVIVGFVK